MKKIICLLLLLSLITGCFAACVKKDNPHPGDNDQNNGSTESGEGDTEGEGNTDGEGEPEPEKLPRLDFLTADLNEYIELDEKYYKGYTVTIDPNRLKPIEVENYIIQLLREKKGKDPIEGDGVVSVGDVVNIFYKGYYLSGEDKVYFEGGSNVGSQSYALEIGSGSFIVGFEYNMIGMVISEHSSENPFVVEAYFPENYGSQELKGKTAYFEVYAEILEDGSYNIKEYEAPELSESFVIDTLGFVAEELESYEGEDILSKFRSLVREMLIYENNLDEKTLTENAFWDSAIGGAVIKQYPEGELDVIFEQLVAEIEDVYKSNIYYEYYYPTLEIFIRVYLGLSENDDWEKALMEVAKENVKEKLIFYYVVRKENLLPTQEEYDEAFKKYLEKSLEDMDITKDKYDTEEEYLKVLEYYKEQLEKNGSMESIKEMLYYQHGIEGILDFAIINTLE